MEGMRDGRVSGRGNDWGDGGNRSSSSEEDTLGVCIF
jgi:hypothetical protein